jgi:hypothetical protein
MVWDVQFAESVTTAKAVTGGVRAFNCARVYGPSTVVLTNRFRPTTLTLTPSSLIAESPTEVELVALGILLVVRPDIPPPPPLGGGVICAEHAVAINANNATILIRQSLPGARIPQTD